MTDSENPDERNTSYDVSRCCIVPDLTPDSLDLSRQRQAALSSWDNEGGAGPYGRQKTPISDEAQSEVPELTNTELVQLRVRVIALENLVISLLAEVPDRQLGLAREMAVFISPRPGFTGDRLTIHAAAHMIDLVERAGRFRAAKP
jgi:hypothetical protein